MANEYIVIKEKCEEFGHIALTKGVFDTIVCLTVDEDEKVVLCDNKAFTKPSISKITKNELNISVDIKVKFGANVNEVCEKLQDKIHQTIFQMTELNCRSVNIRVTGFVF